jgi:hypothetical protein
MKLECNKNIAIFSKKIKKTNYRYIIKSGLYKFHHLGFDTVIAKDAQHMRNPSYTRNQSK